ncbi:50S ribosomal protein L22 [Candidatus Woesearchaeota archaeon]|nr:50S ribosomal protein L22 [Candidatus Woesearchaeota archaeon]MBW2978547.1 50S ribosomal protein L22 [Candidatus Woesearchaeota archaeon]
MAYKYSAEIKENCSRAVGMSLPISLKQSIMVCASIRGMSVDKSKEYLEAVVKKKKPVAFTRFNKDMGHKKGIAAGRFPVNACKNILSIVKSAESNAQFKGLSSANLIVSHASAQKGPSTWRFGRHRRRKAKRSHIEIVLSESKKQESKKSTLVKKENIKSEPKKNLVSDKNKKSEEKNKTNEKINKEIKK